MVIPSLARAGVLLVALGGIPLSAPAAAQETTGLPAHPAGPPALGSEDLGYLGANAALAGVVAGLLRWHRGGGFLEGFRGGALGGAVAYAGRRTATSAPDIAGLLGRQVGALGASMARNAGDTVPLLSRITLPLGPLRLDVGPGAGAEGPRLRVELFDAAMLAYGVARSGWDLDVGQSIRSAAPVFVDRGRRFVHGGSAGSTYGGVIVLRDTPEEIFEPSLLHERAHVLQLDFIHRAWLGPLEDRVLAGVPLPERVRARLELDLLVQALLGAGELLGVQDSMVHPLEREAEFLEGR